MKNNSLFSQLTGLFLGFMIFCALFLTPNAIAISESQSDYERSIEAVVRHKEFYKPGHFEISAIAGAMPYDSVISHYMLGGRMTWHMADHFGWEIVDLQVSFPAVSDFTRGFVSSYGISNLQTTKLNIMGTTNFLVSPIYGKIRLFGASVLYFDLYAVAGLGMAKTQTIKYSAAGSSGMGETSMRSGFDPAFDLGIGFKFFINRGMAFIFDMRDYVVYTQLYGKNQLRSNFSVSAGLSFFLPLF